MLRQLANKLNPWQIDLAASGLIVLLTTVVWLAAIAPARRDYLDRDNRMAQLAEQVRSQRDLDNRLKRTRDAAGGVRRFLTEQNLTLEPRTRLNDRLTAIYNLASECGVSPDNIEPQREASEAMFTTVSLRLGGRGTYLNCVKFLDTLRKQMPYITVSAVEILGSPADGEPTVAFNFQLLWHAAPAAMASN